MANSNARLKEALTGGSNVKEKAGPPVSDGVLTPTPDSPEILEWRSKSAVDCAGTSSSYLDEEEDGEHDLFAWGTEPQRDKDATHVGILTCRSQTT